MPEGGWGPNSGAPRLRCVCGVMELREITWVVLLAAAPSSRSQMLQPSLRGTKDAQDSLTLVLQRNSRVAEVADYTGGVLRLPLSTLLSDSTAL